MSFVCDANKEDASQAGDSKILLCGHMGHMMAGDYFWRLILHMGHMMAGDYFCRLILIPLATKEDISQASPILVLDFEISKLEG